MKQNNKKLNKKLVTHNGSFHSDDIFATAMLSLMLERKNENFEIIRTRDPKTIEKGDYVYDVGGVYDKKMNRFDHHQKGGAEKRENGIEYSSVGLVWKKFGEKLCGSLKTAKIIDRRLVSPIDAADNGINLVENKYDISPYYIQDFIYSMRPTWRENNLDCDIMFFKCVDFAKEILLREIIQAKDAILAMDKVISIYKKSTNKKIIVLDKDYPYEDILCDFPEPLFVIYPRTHDNFWGIRTVKENPRTFINKKDLPNSWAGLRDEELHKITGVKDAVFCHRALFMAVAKSKEGAIKLAKLALNF